MKKGRASALPENQLPAPSPAAPIAPAAPVIARASEAVADHGTDIVVGPPPAASPRVANHPYVFRVGRQAGRRRQSVGHRRGRARTQRDRAEGGKSGNCVFQIAHQASPLWKTLQRDGGEKVALFVARMSAAISGDDGAGRPRISLTLMGYGYRYRPVASTSVATSV